MMIETIAYAVAVCVLISLAFAVGVISGLDGDRSAKGLVGYRKRGILLSSAIVFPLSVLVFIELIVKYVVTGGKVGEE